MTKEEMQTIIALTPAQYKAFNGLIRAIKKCKAFNVLFYLNLDNLGALNGNNVKSVVGYEETGEERFGPYYLGELDFPTVRIVCSFADDTHHVVLNDKCKIKPLKDPKFF